MNQPINNSRSDHLNIANHQQKPTSPWWQKPTFKITIAVLGLLAILIAMNISVIKYETHLATGETVLLTLAPVDPRGFMQGDYMALSYALERDVFNALPSESHDLNPEFNDSEPSPNVYEPSEGYVIVKVDEHNFGQFVRLADSAKRDTLANNEIPIHYRIRNGSVQLATNAFFFQEGHADAFEAAEYGLFRVNEQGEPLLTAMVNEDFKVIKGTSNQAEETSN